MNNLGARVYGFAAIMMGAAGFIWGELATGWLPLPATGRTALAYALSALLLAGGALINWRQRWGGAVLAAIFGFGFAVVDGPALAMHLGQFGYWESSAEPLALAMAGLVAFASAGETPASQRVARIGCIGFALCLFVFGAAHFVYAAYTASLVPAWLPPNQMFWVYATGAAAIAAGLAILCGILDAWAARLLAAMYIVFGALVHTPLLWAKPADHFRWVEFIVNLALIGAAWIVADRLAARETMA